MEEAIAELTEAIALYHANEPGLDKLSITLFKAAEPLLAKLQAIRTQQKSDEPLQRGDSNGGGGG
jgi:hypothetical protein